MNRLFVKLPWFVSASAIVAAATVLAIGVNVLVGPYFERSFLDEADPLGLASDVPAAPTRTAVPAAAATADSAATPSPGQPTDTDTAPGVLAQGDWRDGEPGHNGKGIAKIIRKQDGKLVLRVEEFSVTNGPDLFVVLSPNAEGYADGSLNLGDLKATDGAFNYEIPDGTDLSLYKSVVVWCKSFDITFAVATLEAV